jgi:hypothetical protein
MGAKGIFVGVLYGSRLAFQSLGLVTKTSIKRRKAKTTFRKTLINQGIPPKVAKEIAEEYPNPINEIFSLIKNIT